MIARSKPLPIHEFPSRIDEVARLKEHVAKIPTLTRDAQYLLYPDGDEAVKCHSDLGGSEDWLTDVDLAKMLCELLNAAPALLDVLGEIRPGDRQLIAYASDEIEETHHAPEWDAVKDALRRYRDIARKMEENR
ncbi:hypothetical protein M0R72_08295 [Candidatus Pacearchaeota archaeon]|jgi:hypothetical protein|nr:hypothetical protein [Candidatus Pacearchaeota archaeon]